MSDPRTDPALGGLFLPRPSTTEPRSVRRAFVAWLVATGLGLLSLVLAAVFPPTAEQVAGHLADLGTPPERVTGAAAAAVAAGEGQVGAPEVVAGVVVTLLFVWTGASMRTGAAWAHFATSAFAVVLVAGAAGVGLVSVLAPVPQPAGGGSTAVLLAAGVAAAVTAGLLFGRSSREWYATNPHL